MGVLPQENTDIVDFIKIKNFNMTKDIINEVRW